MERISITKTYEFDMTMSELAHNINIKKSLMRMNQHAIEETLKEMYVLKAIVRSQRTQTQQAKVEYLGHQLKFWRKEYANEMKELRRMKCEFKGRQCLLNGGSEMGYLSRQMYY